MSQTLILLLIAWPSVSLFLSIIFLMAAMLHAVLTPSVVWLRTIVGLELMLWIWALPAFIFCTLPVRMPQGDHEATPLSQSTPTVSLHGSRSALIVSGNEESPVVSPGTAHYDRLTGSNSGVEK
ncbi:hypothetical protein DEU56DRAFT_761021 [Suillus clintonianus]|uniref:uncharacterized protein n=1 Tax=Suillus clintonianus TaxID=1904413 RepID=UPI001B881B3F|nr:uncharacterized protein DEU56DRAFT_761021 [Suillus clintonianus]KAG2119373.1 hypothetical protein DEU56DRAFT_761021 [Suillus clintonianus]